MKKHIVLSVNSNQDYLFYTPLVFWAWRYFGWEPILFYHRSQSSRDSKGEWSTTAYLEQILDNNNVGIPKLLQTIPDYRSDTITQISRLYGSCLNYGENSYLMTGDIDMLPLSDYWKIPEPNPIPGPTLEPMVWGHDLTGFGHYPICYIGMQQSKWEIVMKIDSTDYNQLIKRDLDTLPQAKDPDFYKYWFSDQDLITQRLNEYGKDKITLVNRGQGKHGYARGRVDRGSGGWVLDQPELIDAHLEQQTHHSAAKIARLMTLLYHVWPNEDWAWFIQYTQDFRKLTGHSG